MSAASFFSNPYVQAGLSAAAQVAIARAMRPKVRRLRPTPDTQINREASAAADRERRRRAQGGARQTILTGPLGALESPLVRRTVLSGG